MADTTESLKPCPFCEDAPNTLTNNSRCYDGSMLTTLSCSNHECGASIVGHDNDPVDRWNHRPLEDKLREELMDAEEMLSADASTHLTQERFDAAYTERNHLVAALAKVYPSGLRKTDIEGWDEDWQGCCTIDLPTGQISYHYHDSEAYLFEGLPPYRGEYDGHTKEIVHERLRDLPAWSWGSTV